MSLVAIARQRQHQGASKKPLDLYSTDTAGRGSSVVSDGDCIIMSTPDASFSTSGC
ncbi:MAG: hypothetical protein H0T79_04275 [Deltaproteobacteria bacterium]|nr:hypothetical protein [Deltaproteobacteria bacterium]